VKTLGLMYITHAKLAVREFSSVLFGILLPAGLIVLLGFINAGSPEGYAMMTEQLGTSFGAVSTLGIASVGLMGLPLTLSDYRQRKILKRYQVTPVSPMTLLSANLLFCFTLSIVSAFLVYALSAIFFDFRLQGSALTFALAFLLVMLSIHAIGMIVASLAKNSQMAGVIASFLYFPMILLSGATIPITLFPSALQDIANILPLRHGIMLLTSATLGEPLANHIFSILVLTIVAITGIAVSLKFFSWE